jgi:hypothetical protein
MSHTSLKNSAATVVWTTALLAAHSLLAEEIGALTIAAPQVTLSAVNNKNSVDMIHLLSLSDKLSQLNSLI